jgi:hypothetical protein
MIHFKKPAVSVLDCRDAIYRVSCHIIASHAILDSILDSILAMRRDKSRLYQFVFSKAEIAVKKQQQYAIY